MGPRLSRRWLFGPLVVLAGRLDVGRVSVQLCITILIVCIKTSNYVKCFHLEHQVK